MAVGDNPHDLRHFDIGFDEQNRVKITNVKPGEESSAVIALLDAQSRMGTLKFPALNHRSTQHPLASSPVSVVITSYLADYQQDVSLSTFKRRAGHLRVFQEYVGDAKIDTIPRLLLTEFWDDLKLMPPQKDVRPEFRNWSLRKVLQKQKASQAKGLEVKGMSKQTQAHYREAVSGFYEWCCERDIVEKNIAAKKEGKRSKSYREEVANDSREAFTGEDLKRIFEHDFYRTNQYKHPYQYWVPHIALFTGARINEICQLYVEDVVCHEGFYAFNFCAVDSGTDSGSNKIHRSDVKHKTIAGKRLTPIHPKLVELGFLYFVESMKKDGQERLFPELRYSEKGGYGTRASRWFMGEFLRPKVGITNPSKVFHCFRNTVITGLTDLLFDIPEGEMIKDKDMIIKAVVGHKVEGVTFGVYLTRFHPKITSRVLAPLNWNVVLTPFVQPEKKSLRLSAAHRTASP